ncbi:MAG: phage holin family protein [Clostridium sp.]|uniref:phage holin family protein n=1 Tax=Clostridium sp. TaxID=1506 RepID=UPI003EE78BC5
MLINLLEEKWTLVFTAGGTLMTFLFGAWDMPLQILLMAVILDYFSGMLKAFYLGEVSSKKGYKGLVKKVGIFFVVIVAQMADMLLGLLVFRSAICLFFSANEMISVLENVGSMGIPIPAFLKDKLAQVKSESDEKDIDNIV